jgi:hypothetical protein
MSNRKRGLHDLYLTWSNLSVTCWSCVRFPQHSGFLYHLTCCQAINRFDKPSIVSRCYMQNLKWIEEVLLNMCFTADNRWLLQYYVVQIVNIFILIFYRKSTRKQQWMDYVIFSNILWSSCWERSGL